MPWLRRMISGAVEDDQADDDDHPMNAGTHHVLSGLPSASGG